MRCRAVDECGAPMVSIPGGEPLIHKEMPQIVAGIVARKKFVYLCTNAILLAKHIDEYQPSPYLTFSIHLDGNRERHDESVCLEGVYDKAVAAIQLARSKGFRVTINCTLFSGENPDEVADFFDTAMGLGIEGITVSPGFSYQHAPRQDVFLGRSASKRLFREIFKRGAAAARASVDLQSLRAVPGLPRRQPDLSVHAVEQSDLQRLRLAAALLPADRRGLCADLQVPDRGHRMGAGTASARTRACDNCMAHCGFEGTAVNDAFSHPLKALLTSLRGPEGVRAHGAGAARPLCGRHRPSDGRSHPGERDQAHEPRVRGFRRSGGDPLRALAAAAGETG